MILRQMKQRGIKPSKQALKWLAEKPVSSYTIPTIEAVDMISSKFGKLSPVGSFIYKIQRYPGDIDLMENIIKVKNGKDPIKEIENSIQEIIRKVKKETLGKTNFFLGDVKAGIDIRFVPIDKAFGEIIGNKIIGYNYEKSFIALENLKKQKAIDDKEYDEMKDLLKRKPTLEEHHILHDLIHEKKILRWGMNELLRGYKKVKTNKKITLYDAIQQPEIVKIDLWYWLTPRFVEITNFLRLFVRDKKKLKRINVKEPSYVPDMKKQMQKYLFDKYHFNPFKALKRMLVLSFIAKDDKTSKLLTRLMSTGNAILYQIVGDMKVLMEMTEKLDAPPYEKMGIEVDEMKERISRVYEFKIPDTIYKKVNTLYEAFSSGNKRRIILILDDLIKHLSSILNFHTIAWLKKKKILPLSKKYL